MLDANPISVQHAPMSRAERIGWIDSLKGLAIFAVVLGHQHPPYLLKPWIYSFHVPLFFFIAGHLYHPEKYARFRDLLKRRAQNLLLPYFIFSLFTYVVWLAFSREYGADVQTAIPPFKPLLGTFYSIGVGDWLVHNVPLWFLTCLLVTEGLFFWLQRHLRKPGRIVLGLVAMALLSIGLDRLAIARLPWSADVALIAVVFYGAGFLTQQRLQTNAMPAEGRLVAAILLLLGINLGLGFRNGPIDLNLNDIASPLLFYPAAFAGIAFFVLLARRLPPSRTAAWLGRNTLLILALHKLSGAVLVKIVLERGLQIPLAATAGSLAWSLFISIGSLALLTPVAWLINAKAPSLVGRSDPAVRPGVV